MTTIRIQVEQPTPTGDAPATGYLFWTPTRLRTTPTTIILPGQFQAHLTDGVAVINPTPTADWVYKVEEHFVNAPKRTLYLAVPDSPDEILYTELQTVDPETLEPTGPTPLPAWYSYVDGLAASSASSLAAVQTARDEAIAARQITESSTGSAAVHASNAGVSATNASASATTAQGAATTATQKASEASSSASTALTARNDAQTARTDAQAARTDALGAVSAAEYASFTAENHKNGAATYRSQAEAARDQSQLYRDQAEDFHSTTLDAGWVNDAGRLILQRNDSTQVDAGFVVGPPITGVVKGTVTGPETPGATGPQGIQGLKGDPGGIVYGTDLGTSNLNDIQVDGVYRQPTPANATLLNNYPVAGAYTSLIVLRESASYITQKASVNATTGQARVIYERVLAAGVWSAWKAYTSTRVDQTAGRAIYQWDDVNNREQLVYGDTGRRDVAAGIVNGWLVGSFEIRRVGSTVSMNLYGLNRNGSAQNWGYQFPMGFRPVSWVRLLAHTPTTPPVLAPGEIDSTGYMAFSWVAPTSHTVTYQFQTTDPWPTTLPGVAVGTVPNL